MSETKHPQPQSVLEGEVLDKLLDLATAPEGDVAGLTKREVAAMLWVMDRTLAAVHLFARSAVAIERGDHAEGETLLGQYLATAGDAADRLQEVIHRISTNR